MDRTTAKTEMPIASQDRIALGRCSLRQLVLPKQTMTDTALVVPTGNPLAKLLVGFLAKAVGVSFAAHMMGRSNAKVNRQKCGAFLSAFNLQLVR
jgi:hypothetical protein